MKDFLKYVLATVVGIFAFLLVMGIFGMMSIIGMISSSKATTPIEENSVLVLNLKGSMNERSVENPFAAISGQIAGGDGLQETLSAIAKAKKNEDIKGIYIEAGLFNADYASMQELRSALLDFRKSGKWIVAYGDTYTQGTYYLASVANKVWLNPQGEIDWHGLASQPMFFKDLLAKFGIQMQVIKVGKYKSATEMFIADKMSDPNREQTQAYINGLWNNICKEVSASRGISVADLNLYADSLITFSSQEDLLKKKLIDGLLYTDQVKDKVKEMLKLEKDDDINQVSVAEMLNVKETTEGDKIAVYYAYGDIVSDASTDGLMAQGDKIVSKDVCRDLQALADDDDIHAVVIRINSGGGSAYASEQMWHQIEMLKKKKPVVVSMGGMAASGGYYMSCNANHIVAEPTTLTGSIGIFGMIPDVSQLLTQKLGVKFDLVKTNAHSDFGTQARPFTAQETEYLTRYIARGYKLFRKRVADGRKLSVDQVEAIAQGHVFTGEDALKLKLVDELGGLDKAVAKAAKLAKLDKYHTVNYPAAPDFFSNILQQTVNGGDNYLDGHLRAVLGEYYEPFMLLKTMNEQDVIQARVPFYLNIH